MRKFSYNFRKMRPRVDLYWVYRCAGLDFKNEPAVKDIRQVHANERTIELMERVLKRGIRRQYPFMRERKVNSEVGFAMLNYAPVTNNEVPDNEIWVYDEDELSN